MSENPFQSPMASNQASPYANTGGGQLPVGVIMPLANAKGWMKLIGIVQMVVGAMYCITIVGIVIAWLPIWTGWLLTKASASLENPQSPEQVNDAMTKLGTVFTIAGVLTVISLIFTLLYVLFIIAVVVLGVGAGAMSGGGN